MPTRIVRLLVASSLIGTQAHAQTDADRAEAYRARAAAYMKELAVQSLPPGDTLVTWNARGPVLFHTASRDSGGVQAGMLRNDRMLGLTDVRWSGAAPSAFRTRWFTPNAGGFDSTDIRGVRRDDTVLITRPGRPDTTLALPSLPWAVADYGMEELLLPAFDSGNPRVPYRVAVLRPYGLKWDTLRVTERTNVPGRGWNVISYVESGEQWRLAVTDAQQVLWLRRSKHPDDDKHPLEGTALWAIYVRLLPVLRSATQPVSP